MKHNYKEIQENTRKFNQRELIKSTIGITMTAILTVSILFLLAMTISCSSNTGSNCDDPVKVEAVKDYVHNPSTLNRSQNKTIPNLALTNDKVVEGNITVQNDINLNGYTLTVYGQVKASRINGPGNLLYCTKILQWGTQNGVNQTKMGCSTLGMDEVVYVKETYNCD